MENLRIFRILESLGLIEADVLVWLIEVSLFKRFDMEWLPYRTSTKMFIPKLFTGPKGEVYTDYTSYTTL
jgi:hypothetical protein